MSAQSVLFDAPGPKARRNVLIVNVVALLGVAVVAWLVFGKLGERGQLGRKVLERHKIHDILAFSSAVIGEQTPGILWRLY